MNWFQVWTICWQVSVFMTPLVLGAAVLWLKSQFVTKTDATVERNRIDATIGKVEAAIQSEHSRVDGEFSVQKTERDQRYEKLKDKTADHEGRIKALENELTAPPTRHSLNNEITKLIGVINRVDSAVTGMAEQARTTQSYLHTLVERGLDR